MDVDTIAPYVSGLLHLASITPYPSDPGTIVGTGKAIAINAD